MITRVQSHFVVNISVYPMQCTISKSNHSPVGVFWVSLEHMMAKLFI